MILCFMFTISGDILHFLLMSLSTAIGRVLEIKVVAYAFNPSTQTGLCELAANLRTLGEPGLCRETLSQTNRKKVWADVEITWAEHLAFFQCLARRSCPLQGTLLQG